MALFISPTSSRNSVPPSASSNRPFLPMGLCTGRFQLLGKTRILLQQPQTFDISLETVHEEAVVERFAGD